MIKIKKRKILLLPGDGIGPEVIAEVKKILEWLNKNKSLDFGIKCVIAPSFADIFYSNCFKNGILPIVLDEKIIQEIAEYSKREENIEIKLEPQEIIFGNKAVKFDLDSFKKKCLVEGLDDIALSLKKLQNIQSYEIKIKDSKPWLTNND